MRYHRATSLGEASLFIPTEHFSGRYYLLQIRNNTVFTNMVTKRLLILYNACRAGLDGSMSASGSAGPGFDPRRGSKFSFENFQLRS